jgi:hypothetical protein
VRGVPEADIGVLFADNDPLTSADRELAGGAEAGVQERGEQPDLGLVVPASGQVVSRGQLRLIALLAPSADAGTRSHSACAAALASAQKVRGAKGLALQHAPDCAGSATVRHFAPACAR